MTLIHSLLARLTTRSRVRWSGPSRRACLSRSLMGAAGLLAAVAVVMVTGLDRAMLAGPGRFWSRVSSRGPAPAGTGATATAPFRADPAPVAGWVTGKAGPDLRPVTSYTLSARLDPLEHSVSARGVIYWRNTSNRPANDLYLHLYLNAFESERTLFFRAIPVGSRSGSRLMRPGRTELRRLVARELGFVDLWPRAERHSPGDPDDRTDLRIPLPAPVPPEGELTLEVEFVSWLPSLVERTGFVDDFYFVAQWFPKLARLEPDGTWRHFAFHPLAEFYADFGHYQVTLDVPEAMRVGATGQRTAERLESGRRVLHYQADQVHDFAWTAWPGYRERSELIDGVEVLLLYPEGYEQNAERSVAALKHALPRYGTLYGRYPYPALTVVHPPPMAAQAGAMEYPTLITTGGPWWAGHLTRQPEVVTVHELAHQWFQGMVATDEARWPFLDEGLASFAEAAVLDEMFGPGSLVSLPGLELSLRELRRVLSQRARRSDSIAQPASGFSSFTSLSELAYARTATLLDTLGQVYGNDRLFTALGRYAREQRFLHPGPEVLLGYLQQHLGTDAARVARAVLFDKASVDYRIRWLESRALDASLGPAAEASLVQGRSNRYLGQALVVREGELELPVEIELVDATGRRYQSLWDGHGSWKWIEATGPEPFVAAVADPRRKIGLDDDLTNNAVRLRPALPVRTLERITYWLGLLVSGWL